MLISKLPNKYWKSYSIIVIQLRVYFYSAARVAVLGSGGRGLVEVCMGFGTGERDCCGMGWVDVNGPCIPFLLVLLSSRRVCICSVRSAVVRLSGRDSCAGLDNSLPFWSVDGDLGRVVRVDLQLVPIHFLKKAHLCA